MPYWINEDQACAPDSRLTEGFRDSSDFTRLRGNYSFGGTRQYDFPFKYKRTQKKSHERGEEEGDGEGEGEGEGIDFTQTGKSSHIMRPYLTLKIHVSDTSSDKLPTG